MTAFPLKQHSKRAKELGVQEVLLKPFSLAELAGAIERLLPSAGADGPTISQV